MTSRIRARMNTIAMRARMMAWRMARTSENSSNTSSRKAVRETAAGWWTLWPQAGVYSLRRRRIYFQEQADGAVAERNRGVCCIRWWLVDLLYTRSVGPYVHLRHDRSLRPKRQTSALCLGQAAEENAYACKMTYIFIWLALLESSHLFLVFRKALLSRHCGYSTAFWYFPSIPIMTSTCLLMSKTQ